MLSDCKMKYVTVKFLNFRTPESFAANNKRPNHMLICPKDANGMANTEELVV